MLLVMVAIGGTDILFALDSIPAIFGLTQNTFIVFTATAFSLLGLRQLYFLIDGLLDRLIYLSYGLAAILAFIGVKLILHALHENNLPFINDGEHVEVVEISTGLSLSVIIGVLVDHRDRLAGQPGRQGPDRRSPTRVGTPAATWTPSTPDDPAERERIYRALEAEREQIRQLGPKYQEKARQERPLMELLDQVKASHDSAIDRGDAPPRSEVVPRPASRPA